jgi:twitching motility protein PilI
MSDSPRPSPLDWLVRLEHLCRDHAQAVPRQVQDENTWVGIAFRLGQLNLVAPLAEVAEVLTPPGLSQVPRTRAWVCGIANVRGNLMPVMDLLGYLYDRPAVANRRSRVLVVNHQGLCTGLVVDAVLGLRHFRNEQRCRELPGVDARIQEYMTHGFRDGTELWGVFSVHRLAETPRFLQAAV